MTKHIPIEQLIDYLHQELSPADDARVLAHLNECTTCSSELERESALTEAFRAAALADERELPPMVKANVWEAIRHEPAPSIWPAWMRPAFAVPFAAIVAAAGVFSFGMLQNAGPRIDANYYLAQHASGRLNPLTETVVHSTDPIEESSAASAPVSFASITQPFDAPEPTTAP